uniref:Uncharacterized protein n=1 Tax=viral metagenome TaxID=1070528 RepID=A0A6C0IR31_9ZZZZ
MFPKTVILTVDSHGFYTVDKGEIDEDIIDISTTSIFENSFIKNVYKINATILGINNISTKVTCNKTMNKVKKYIKKHNTQLQDFTEDQLHKFVLDLRDLLVESNDLFVKSLENDVRIFKRKNINKENTKMFSDYLYHYDKSYTIEHNVLFDKNYVRFEEDKQHNDELREMISGINLFDIMNAYNIQIFSLFELIQFLIAFQVENIIIIDFSCSEFKDLNSVRGLTDRDVRAIRRNWLK